MRNDYKLNERYFFLFLPLKIISVLLFRKLNLVLIIFNVFAGTKIASSSSAFIKQGSGWDALLMHIVIKIKLNLIYFHVISLILCVPKFTVFNLSTEKIMPWDPCSYPYITLTGCVSSVVSPCSVVVNTSD